MEAVLFRTNPATMQNKYASQVFRLHVRTYKCGIQGLALNQWAHTTAPAYSVHRKEPIHVREAKVTTSLRPLKVCRQPLPYGEMANASTCSRTPRPDLRGRQKRTQSEDGKHNLYAPR